MHSLSPIDCQTQHNRYVLDNPIEKQLQKESALISELMTQMPEKKLEEFNTEYERLNAAAANMLPKLEYLTVLLKEFKFKCAGANSPN